jgi:hypothetical protein
LVRLLHYLEMHLARQEASRVKRFLVGIALIAVATSGFAQTSKAAASLQGRTDNAAIDAIVQFMTPPEYRHWLKIEARGGTVKQELKFIKALHVSIPASAIDALSQDPEVTYISPNRPIQAALNNTTAAVLASYPWGLGLDGHGIGVAVIDSGVHMVEDLRTVSKEHHRRRHRRPVRPRHARRRHYRWKRRSVFVPQLRHSAARRRAERPHP